MHNPKSWILQPQLLTDCGIGVEYFIHGAIADRMSFDLRSSRRGGYPSFLHFFWFPAQHSQIIGLPDHSGGINCDCPRAHTAIGKHLSRAELEKIIPKA